MTILEGSYVRWHIIQIPYIFPLLKISFTPIKGKHGPLGVLAIPVTLVQPGGQRGPKRGSEATERGKGVGEAEGGYTPPTVGRFVFILFVYENGIFFHIK